MKIFSFLFIDQLEIDVSSTSINNRSVPYTDFPIFNSETESVLPLYTFTYPYSPGPMAGSSNDYDYLLLSYPLPHNSNSLVLFDGDKCVSVKLIPHVVYDICWSKSTNAFIVATPHRLYEYNPINNTLSEPYVIRANYRVLSTITCNATDLFTVHAPNTLLYKRQVNGPFLEKQEWSTNDILCELGDQCIGSIRFDERQQICKLIFA